MDGIISREVYIYMGGYIAPTLRQHEWGEVWLWHGCNAPFLASFGWIFIAPLSDSGPSGERCNCAGSVHSGLCGKDVPLIVAEVILRHNHPLCCYVEFHHLWVLSSFVSGTPHYDSGYWWNFLCHDSEWIGKVPICLEIAPGWLLLLLLEFRRLKVYVRRSVSKGRKNCPFLPILLDFPSY